MKPLYQLTAAALLASASAAMAATQVNIADPNYANRAAKVEPGDRLAVQEVPPASFVHDGVAPVHQGSGCVLLAAPASQALVVRQVRINVDSITAGPGNQVWLYRDAACNTFPVSVITPAGLGPNAVAFDPGVAIAAGGGFSVKVVGSPLVYVFMDAFTVPAKVVPAQPPMGSGVVHR